MRQLVVLALVALLASACGSVPSQTAASGRPTPSATGSPLPPARARPTAVLRHIPLAFPPTQMIAGRHGVAYAVLAVPGTVRARWARVARVVPATGRVATSERLTAGRFLALGRDALWFLGGRTLYRLDPASLVVRDRIALPAVGRGVAAGPSGVWVSTGRSLLRLDPATGSVVRTVSGGRYDDVAYGPRGGILYTTESPHGEGLVITARDPHTGSARARSGDLPSIRGGILLPEPDGLWTVFPTGNFAAAYRLAMPDLRVSIPGPEVGTNATAATLSGNRIWLADPIGRVSCLDAATGHRRARIHVPDSQIAVQVDGRLLVATADGITVIGPPADCRR